jgi:hypothetical protein
MSQSWYADAPLPLLRMNSGGDMIGLLVKVHLAPDDDDAAVGWTNSAATDDQRATGSPTESCLASLR